MRTKNTVAFDYKALSDVGMIQSENIGNQDKFISDMCGARQSNIISGKSSGTRGMQYPKFHNTLMELNFFGKIVPECDFNLYNILRDVELFDPKEFDVYYLDCNYIQQTLPDIKNGLFFLIPKEYNSQTKNNITVIEVNQIFGTPINKTEFYFPFIQNVFKVKSVNTSMVYLEMFRYLIHASVSYDYRKTKVSKQRSVHPTLSYNKTRL